MDREKLEHGIELFDRGRHFESHEVLEEVWRAEPGPDRRFLQALIHMAVGMFHWTRWNRLGAERQFRKGLHKLAAFLPAHEGVDTRALDALAKSWLRDVGEGAAPPAASIPRQTAPL